GLQQASQEGRLHAPEAVIIVSRRTQPRRIFVSFEGPRCDLQRMAVYDLWLRFLGRYPAHRNASSTSLSYFPLPFSVLRTDSTTAKRCSMSMGNLPAPMPGRPRVR